MTENKQCDL